MNKQAWIGLDLGTSGCRGIAIDDYGEVLTTRRAAFAPVIAGPEGERQQDPAIWWRATVEVLRGVTGDLQGRQIVAIAVDGTSGTVLLTDNHGTPLTPGLMYNDRRARREAERIAAVAPAESAAHGAGSGLAKALYLSAHPDTPSTARIQNQADWIAGRLRGEFGTSDENNALKLGYDPVRRSWPGWIANLGLPIERLPRVVPAGTPIGHICPAASRQTGLPSDVVVAAGTTDSTAACFAAGLRTPGQAVTVLGSTLVTKVVSDCPVFAPQYGVYSHPYQGAWLAGGGSNSGGAVLAHYFNRAQLVEMTARLDPARDTGLEYYPLLEAGERFPVNDPDLPPRLTPRPAQDHLFFQGMLEGMARIERRGYDLLSELGAPRPLAVQTLGGGAANQAWRSIRERILGIPVMTAKHTEAAYGAASLGMSWK